MNEENATKQAMKGGKGGTIPPKERQFGQPNGNPRHNGAWKKEDTARYKLEQMFKLNEEEINAVVDDMNATLFERKLATCIANGEWKELREMLDQVYGAPKQRQEVDLTGEVSGINISVKNFEGE